MTTAERMKTARSLYLMVAGLVLALVVADRWDALISAVREARLPWLVASFVAGFGLIGVGAQLWRTILAGFGQDVAFGHIVLATARSVMARYIPGSVWFALGRVGLLRANGYDTASLTATAGMEIALSLTVGVGAGALVLGAIGALPGGLATVFVAIALLAVASSPPVVGRIVTILSRRSHIVVEPMDWPSHMRAVGAMVLFWAWSAGAFLLYMRAFPVADQFNTLAVLGGFMLSWGIGFLAVFAPQGVGVAEVMLAGILGGADIATLALLIGGYRAVMLVRDVVVSAVAWVTRTVGARGGSASTE